MTIFFDTTSSPGRAAKIRRAQQLFFSVLALGAILGCVAWVWLGWFFASANSTNPIQPVALIPTLVSKPTPASEHTVNAARPDDLFSAAAVRQRPGAHESAQDTTDCVALMAAFSSASNRCTTSTHRHDCALVAVKNQGFKPETYDMCKLFGAPF